MLDWAYTSPGSGPEGALVEDAAPLRRPPPTIPRAHVGQAARYNRLADVWGHSLSVLGHEGPWLHVGGAEGPQAC